MTVAELQLKQHLKQHGYSLTKPRITLFAALQDSEPQSMAALVAACPDLDRATVYRTVDVFEQLGIVHRLPIGWKYKVELTDAFSHHHHHLTCLSCGTITALTEDTVLENRLAELARAHGFTPRDHQVEIRGLCRACAAAAPTTETIA